MVPEQDAMGRGKDFFDTRIEGLEFGPYRDGRQVGIRTGDAVEFVGVEDVGVVEESLRVEPGEVVGEHRALFDGRGRT